MNEDEIESTYTNELKEPCWPFWGNLKSQGNSGFGKDGWEHTIIKENVLKVDVFNRLLLVAWKALRMLKRHSISDLRNAAKEMQVVIEECFEDSLKDETEERIKTLVDSGGWELNYLPADSQGTEWEIRDLIDNWSGEWERLDLPDRDDFNELTALKEYVYYESSVKESIWIFLGLIEPEAHEIFALMAVMSICNAINSNSNCVNGTMALSQVKSLAVATIEAVEALEHAEKLQLEEKVRDSIAKKQPEILEKELSRISNERATKIVEKELARITSESAKKAAAAGLMGARAKNAKYEKLKEWALEKASTMKGDDKGISRKLFKELPSHFLNVSNDPQRLIYETLRARKKSN